MSDFDSLEDVLLDAEMHMDATVERVQENFSGIRTGRANPGLLHNVMVSYYGTKTPLKQLANFSVPEPRILIINPFDKGSTNDVEKAIREANLGLNPATDGGIIRCVFPELTEQRRMEYVKLAKNYAEEGKIAIRNHRRSAKDAMQKMEDDGDVGADEHERSSKQMETLTSKFVTRIDKLLDAKEVDLLEV